VRILNQLESIKLENIQPTRSGIGTAENVIDNTR